jgi:hypothetical protein
MRLINPLRLWAHDDVLVDGNHEMVADGDIPRTKDSDVHVVITAPRAPSSREMRRSFH